MSELLKRGINVYKIFLSNKLAMSLMMFVSGIMMFIAAINGHGNDTVTMPLGITVAGVGFTCWSFYRIGYIKSNRDHAKILQDQKIENSVLILQIAETLLYLIVAALGIFLLLNQGFTNQVLNLMAGGFTILNGLTGTTVIYKRRNHRDFRFYFKAILTIVELGLGLYFVIASSHIELGWLVAMGALTSIAGAIEVISALTPESLQTTVQNGKDILKIIKDK